MFKFVSVLLLLFTLVGTVLNTAEAARFGGGRSFGTQRSMSSFSRAPQAASMARQNSSASRFLAPLAGLAMGGLLAYLFMGHGLGTSILSWLAILGVGFMALQFFRNRFQTQSQAQLITPAAQANQRQGNIYEMHNNASRAENCAPSSPANFDSFSFLREAKVQFMRLQAAYDGKDLVDLRKFTSPEVFAEIQLQLQDRGAEENQTEVVSLDSELLEATSVTEGTEATVKFSGMIKEVVNQPAAPFEELWHFRKSGTQQNWLVVGVQQN